MRWRATVFAGMVLGAGPIKRVASQAPTDVVHERSIEALAAELAAGRVTSVQLVDAYLARVAAYDAAGPGLNSMIRRNAGARTLARQLDAERWAGRIRGPLHGIPIVLKDNFATVDEPTSGGSLGLAGLMTPDEGSVVRRIRDAGAIILGKTNMHELAAGITTISSLGGQTRNPYDPRRCPGGSSGGTGVAVAASLAAVGWGSDTCGSIRIPAAYASLFGLRPTQGAASRAGILPLSHTQDVPGPLARTVMDLAIALEVTVGPDPADSTTAVMATRPAPQFVAAARTGSLRGVRLGLLTTLLREAEPDIRDTVRSAAEAMKAGGAELVEVAMVGLDSLLGGSSVLNYETKYDLIDFLSRIPGAPAGSLQEILAQGLYHDAMEARLRRADTVSARDSDAYRRAFGQRAVLRERVVAVLDSLRLDGLVYPTMLRRPVLIGDPQLGGTCMLSSHSGLPALSVPAGFTADGLPVGLEVIGRAFDDVRLVEIAAGFERLGTRRRPPPTTPPLVAGRGPVAARFTATARGAGVAATGVFRFEPATGGLDYDVTVVGANGGRVQAVVLRRGGVGGAAGPVIQRVLGPGDRRGRGQVVLTGLNREALGGGALTMEVFVAGVTGSTVTAILKSPSR
ncbi:MAG: amidase [Gemmatimonadales bacterium]